MYKQIVLSLVLAVAVAVGGFTTSVHAQSSGIQPDTYNQAPGTGNTIGDTTTGTANDNTGFDWRWLLPLLAIPVVLLLMRDRREDDRSTYRSSGMAGAKGGKSQRDAEEYDE